MSATGLHNSPILSLASFGTNIFAGTKGSGVYFSSNNGDSWQVLNDGLTNFSINTLYVNDDFLYAGTDGGGVFKLKLSELVNVKDDIVTNNTDFIIISPNPAIEEIEVIFSKENSNQAQVLVANIYNL